MIIPTVKIDDPNKPGDYMIVNADHPLASGQASDDGGGPEPITPETIEAMSKEDVIAMLEAHGVDVNTRKRVDTLRADLASVMFVSLGDGT